MDWVQLKAQLPVLVILLPLIGTAYQLYGDVDEIKKSLGEGTLPVMELKIEQMQKTLEKQELEREKLIELMRASQNKVDSLIELLIKEKKVKGSEVF
jgi:response regulator of citrate/malate metabolism